MEGRRPISVWDWLGLGRQGTPYEVLETVQPVVQVPQLYFPPAIGNYQSTTALIAGTLIVPLPPAPAGSSRLWLHLWMNRTVSAGGDNTQLSSGVTAAGGGALVWQADGNWGIFFLPIIGGVSNHALIAASGFPSTIFGVPPILATARSPLAIRALAVAAAGNLNLSGVYVDVPEAASFPAENL